jgi:hypothetical protein
MHVKRNSEARSRNHCCRIEAISITCYERVSVALVIQHTKRKRCVILSSVTSTSLPYFSAFSHKEHNFRKNLIKFKICVLFIYMTFI